MFDLDHGAMYAALTPLMIGVHGAESPHVEDVLTEVLGSDPQRRLEDLAARLGAPRTLAEIGFPVDAIRGAAEAIALHADRSADELEKVLSAAATGDPS